MTTTKDLQVIVLCGGKGERLKPLTESIPKPLVAINNRAILSYIIEHLKKYQLEEIIFTTGYKSNMIDDFVKEINLHGHYTTFDSGDVDIIERIKSVKHLIRNDFIVVYGDTLSDVNIDELIRFHLSQSKPATVTLWPLRSTFGVLDLNESNVVVSYQEKPVLDKWINIGYFYFKKEAFSMMEKFNRYEDFIKELVEKRLLTGHKHLGLHITVNTQKELQEAEANIDKIVL
jgi:glucose-1-phosphate cytidylyltransferase